MAKIVTSTEVALYNAGVIANGQPAMRIGDVIFFYTDRTPIGNIFNKSVWSGARTGATFWIEGSPLSYGSIEIGSNTLLTAPSDAQNPNRIHFFNGSGLVTRISTSLGGREFQLNNFNYIECDFETHSHPGLRDGWGSGRSGTFGLRVSNSQKSQSAMCLKIENSLGTMKHVAIRGCEMDMGGFAKLRASFAVNEVDSFVIERNLLCRSVGGEGMYIGSTAGSPWPLHRNMKVRDNLIICTAAEAIQLGQVGDGSIVRNNLMFIAAVDYRDAFQPAGQDTGMQIDTSQGDVLIEKNILQGFGSSGLHLFSKDPSLTDFDGDEIAGDITFGTGVTRINNNAFLEGKKGHSIRIAKEYIYATKTIFRNNDIVNSARNYTDVGDLSDYHFDMGFLNGDTSPIKIIGGNIVNDGYDVLSGDTSSTEYYNVTRGATDVPEYVNSGFDYIDTTKISKWAPSYAAGHYYSASDTSVDPSVLTDGGSVSMTLRNSSGTANTGAAFVGGETLRIYSSATKLFHGTCVSYSGGGGGTGVIQINTISNRLGSGATTSWTVAKRISYTTDDFVILAEDGLSLDMLFYKCISAHDSEDETRPDLDPSKWEVVYWDENGKSMYDPAWNGNYYTTDFMEVAGDFRLVKDSYHHALGRGLSCNEQSESKTMYGWQWKDEQGTIRDIPGAYDITLTLADYSYLRTGRYYRGWVRRMNSSGVLETARYSDWKTI